MLTIWTNASAKLVGQTFGKSLRAMRPDVPEHRFLPYDPDVAPPVPAAGEVILVCGYKPVDTLQKKGLLPKNRKVGSLRESVIKQGEGAYMVTYDPGIIQSEPDKASILDWDLRLATRYLTTGSLAPKVGNYEWVGNLQPLIDKIEAKYARTGRAVDLAADLETMGFYPWYPDRDIITAQFTVEAGHSCLLYLGPMKAPVELDKDAPLYDQLVYLFTSPKIKLRGNNLKFDLIWIAEKWGIECTNFKFDNMLVGSLLDENKSNDLNTQAKIMTPIGGYDDYLNSKYDKGHMERIPPGPDLLTYAGGDTDASYRVADVLRDQLMEDEHLAAFYVKILHPAARAFEKIERRGVLVDTQKFAKLREDLTSTIEQGTHTALSLVPNRILLKYRDKIADQKAQGKNPLLPSVLKEYFFGPLGLNLTPKLKTEKTQEPSMAKHHLRMFGDVPAAMQMVECLTQIDTASKTRSTFVDGFLAHLRPDGKLHPTYFLGHAAFAEAEDAESGTTTGRLSAKNPAFQCMVGETRVLTRQGYVRLDRIVEEEGRGYEVLTHTGAWRKIAGVYRNGVRPVFRVTTKSGRAINCTDNHPVLTSHGFVRTADLAVGTLVFGCAHAKSHKSRGDAVRDTHGRETARSGEGDGLHLPLRLWDGSARPRREPDIREHQKLRVPAEDEKNARVYDSELRVLPVLGRHENPLLQPELHCVAPLWGAGDHSLSEVANIRELPGRYGREAGRILSGTARRERGLLSGELLVDTERKADAKHESDPPDHISRQDAVRGGLGERAWAGGSAAAPFVRRVVGGESSYDAIAAYEAGFILEEIVAIEEVGERETFDLTIDTCHSFVAEGLVVHNTLPKKTKWAKRIRACYPAPAGCAIISLDFSQGELRVVACVANEKNMIAAYEQGMDLHSLTGANLAQVEYHQFLSWKDSEDDKLAKLFDDIRGRAKAGNFGLLYGMQVDGFIAYAWANYGLKLNREEAEKIRTLFFQAYPGLLDYHKESVRLAKIHDGIRSPLGRVRHLPTIHARDWDTRSKAERQAINSPIQSCLSDMMLWGIAEIEAAYPNEEIAIIGMIHDALIAYVKEDEVELRCRQAKEILENLPFHELGWQPQLKFPVDAEAGPNLAEMKKVKLIAQ